MKTTNKKLRESIRKVLKELLFTSFMPNLGDEDEEEKSWLKRIGGKHTARLDYSESDELEENDDEEKVE